MCSVNLQHSQAVASGMLVFGMILPQQGSTEMFPLRCLPVV